MQILRNIITRIATYLRWLASAEAVAAAVESGRRPRDRDLAILGIEPGALAAVIRA